MQTNVITIDLETSGLNPHKGTIYMSGVFDGNNYFCARTKEQFQDCLNRYPQHALVGHRVSFDLKFLIHFGWITEDEVLRRGYHCTRILGSLVKDRVPSSFLDWYENERKLKNKSLPKGQSYREGSKLSLKVMAPWYLKVPPFWETPGDYNNEHYNFLDVSYTHSLFQLLMEKIQAEGSLSFYQKLIEWDWMLLQMEMKGICISLNELDEVEKEYQEKRNQLEEELNRLWQPAHNAYKFKQIDQLRIKYQEMAQKQLDKGRDPQKVQVQYQKLFENAVKDIPERINYNSPEQMKWLLKEFRGLDIQHLDSKKGSIESTNKSILNRLADEGHEDIKTFLKYRNADKVLTMYIPTYRELHSNGVIHPSFDIAGTRTGRTSSSKPNLQQVPSYLYRLFRPRPGYKFIQFDLSGIEAALIALYSGDKTLYDILSSGESIHNYNAKVLFQLNCAVSEVKDLYPRERQTVKNTGFAIFYGAGRNRIQTVFSAGGFPLSKKEASLKLEILKRTYPKVFEFHEAITEVFETGQTVYNLFGRPLNLQPDENPYMQGFNTLIQSSASDLNLEAAYRARNTWREKGLDAYPLLVIHDCIVAEARADIADECAEILKNAMTNFKLESEHGPITLQVEGGVSDRWEK